MKKFLILLVLFLTTNTAFSVTNLDFIYINGSNNNNTKMHDWFINGINKFHPVLKKQLEKDKFTYEHMLKNGEYVILDKPSNYFWGYKSQTDLMFMKEHAKLLQSISPWVAYFTRNAISAIMHDAIWVQKQHNMIPILQELDTQIKESAKQGNKVVLLGYSAGTFITLEYLLSKTQYINISNWFANKNIDADMKKLVMSDKNKKTCTLALIASDLTNAGIDGKVVPMKDKATFKNAYANIDKYTEQYCIPDNTVIGVINYASPIPLFYSDMADEKTDTAYFLKHMLKHMFEQDFFFLTVNYADDPLGFPNGVNYKKSEIINSLGIKEENLKGIFYDYSDEMSWRTTAGAHTSYWKTKKRFAKAIVKGYTKGYNAQNVDEEE